MKRRTFIKSTGIVAAGAGLATNYSFKSSEIQNKLPQWKGFNLLDYFFPGKGNRANASTEEDFKWMADWGFDFVRIPMAYPRYIQFDPSKNITPDDVYKLDEKEIDNIQNIVDQANK